MDHRPQLYDDIKDGRAIDDLSKDQLKGLMKNFTMDYQPDEPFVTMIRRELECRPSRKPKPINHNFFKG